MKSFIMKLWRFMPPAEIIIWPSSFTYDLEKTLSEDLGVEPSGEITQLFHRIFNVKGNVSQPGEIWNVSFVGKNRGDLSDQPVCKRHRPLGNSPVCGHRRRRGSWKDGAFK